MYGVPGPSEPAGIRSGMSAALNLQLRGRYIADSCELHFNDNPMKIVRSKDQYLYDENEQDYIDFVSRITNVGHARKEIVDAACRQMGQLGLQMGNNNTDLEDNLTKKLLSTLPSTFDVVLYTNSGTEANDLALQMARNFTNNYDLVVVDGSFHGAGNLLVDICPRVFKLSDEGKKPWVHVIQVPDTFRGEYSDDDDAGNKYFQDAKKVIDRAVANGRKIAGFICEPLMVAHGVVIPPPNWLKLIYSYIKKLGGLVVADEIQCGMGRTGNQLMWAFYQHSVIPDIITVGKPMANGHPFGAVITSKRIASTIKNSDLVYKCDPVGGAISTEVLKIMQEERLINRAHFIGTFLADSLKDLQRNHNVIGDVRHQGIIIGVDIVRVANSKKPSPKIAEAISVSLRKANILVGCEGDYKNVLLFLPAMCITKTDCLYVIRTLHEILKVVELNYLDDLYDTLNTSDSN